YGISDKIQVGAMLPLIFSASGNGLDAGTGKGCDQRMTAPCLSATGLGDLLVEGKLRFYEDPKNGIHLAVIGGFTLPTSIGSNESDFLGDDLPTLRGKFAAHWSHEKVTIGANAGFIIRKPRTVYSSTIGQQLTFGLGAAFAATEKFSLIGEFYGRAGL